MNLNELRDKDLISQLERAMAFDEVWARIILRESRGAGLSSLNVMQIERGRTANLDKALLNCVKAIVEHVECEPGMYANECIGLGGADGLKEAIQALAAELERLK